MQALNVNQDYQVKSYQKNSDFTQTRRYNAKLHDPNRRKMGLPCFE